MEKPDSRRPENIGIRTEAVPLMTTSPTASQIWPWSPFRLPSWRWHLASAIANGNPLAKAIPSPDATVLNAVGVLQSPDESATDESEDSAAVREAISIWQHDQWGRCLLESRLVSGAAAFEVAERTGLSVTVVRAFHDVFFDVESKAKHKSYINHFAVGAPGRVDAPVGLDVAVKAFAYFGGPYVLNQVIAAHADDLTGSGLRDRGLAIVLEPQYAKAIRMAVRAWTTPLTENNAENWMSVYIDQFAAEVLGGRKRSRRSVDAALRRKSQPEKIVTEEQSKLPGQE